MADQTEHGEPLALTPIRQRFERFRQYRDRPGGPLTSAEHVDAIAAAWDVEPLLDQVDRLRAMVARIQALHMQSRTAWTDEYDVCSHCSRGMDLVRWPCDTIRALDREPVDRAAAGGGVGNPAVEGQPSPTICDRPGCRGEPFDAYEVRVRSGCERCWETGAGHG